MNFFKGLLWSEVSKSKYGGLKGLLCEECLSSSSMWWRDLREVSGAKSESRWFEKFIEWKVGDGEKTKFWFDNWVGDQPLGISFPRLFLNSNKKIYIVANMGGQNKFVQRSWYLRFT